MKTKLVFLMIALTFAIGNLKAADRYRVKATNYDISDNLDLEAVASLFGESKNLNVFEKKLNNPKNEISNLDLNQDGYIDYLRVIEASIEGNHLVVIQAVLGEDIFQDVATIDVSRDSHNRYSVLVIGNDYIYGPGYVIEPVYYREPLIFGFFFGPHYQPWHSPYYWGYYPTYYSYRRPYPVHRYRNHIHVHINEHNHYKYHDSGYNHHEKFHNEYSRNDFGTKYPDRSFEKRNEGARNRQDLNQNRRSENPTRYNRVEKSTSNREIENRRSVTTEKNTRETLPSVNHPKAVQEQRRSDNMERKVNNPSQYKSKEVDKPETKRIESRPVEREKSTPVQVNKRSEVNVKSAPVKRESVQTSRPRTDVAKTERKPESKAKVQSENKRTEKPATQAKEKKESGTRR